jgi:NAD(P)-dependent dehydrogenase (short-subunit alcohol dehydrogenase family)
MAAELEGKSALVTGGRQGIGRATALALAGAGADVAVADIVADDGRLDAVVREIASLGRRGLAVRADVSIAADAQTMTRRAVDAFGGIDVLVNCAGVWKMGLPLVECSEEDWDRIIDTNLKGTYLCCRAVGKVMAEKGSGSIVNLSSQVGINPGANIGPYGISKAGIIMLTRELALELGPRDVRVNALAPGVVKTDFNRFIWEKPEDEVRAAAGVPLGRLAEPEDIARAALFLASDEAAYITGAVVPVDGGWHV